MMRVRIDMTVEVDQYDWAQEYGLLLEEVRADVKEYVKGLVQDGHVLPIKVVTVR
jgi:hypothetical protein